jgi:Dyp-type peroxidase family
MPIDLDAELEPIDPDDPKYAGLLANLQGNILKGHGRDHTVHIFLEFAGDVETVRTHLAAVADRFVTSALQQHTESQQFKSFGIPGGLFGNLFLTAKGYRALGFDADALAALLPDPHFSEGMPAHGAELHDPDSATWEDGYRDSRIDAMILLGDDDEHYLLRRARELINELNQFSTLLVVERGNALRNDLGDGIEHFGYVDGRSQPIYYSTDLPQEGGIDQWNPGEPLKRVLVRDPAVADEDAFGSYFVFRKLEQDVLHFKLREQELADELGLDASDRERAGAMVVGRFEDGTPLALSQTDGFTPAKENNFTFEGDSDALKCPFQAHIRKVNPRGDVVRKFGGSEEERERVRRITRRGIPYGSRPEHPNDFQTLDELPTGGVGLLFMCFQASIANQFAFIQASWANNESFVAPNTGRDPVIGQAGAEEPIQQAWPVQWGQAETMAASFGGFVTLKGGEYFFAPSIPFLKVLAPPEA